MKKIFFRALSITVLLSAILLSSFANGDKENEGGETTSPILVTNSWTAAFADMAGIDNITILTPYNVVHPPEYDLTITDIKKVAHATHIVYAGYEAMVSKLKNNVNSEVTLIKIHTGNDYGNIQSEITRLSQMFGTQNVANENLKELKTFFDDWKNNLDAYPSINKDTSVAVNFHYVSIIKEIGFKNIIVFGPKPIEASLLRKIVDAKPQIIIDNLHAPLAKHLLNDLPNTSYALWRNFPSQEEKTLIKTLKNNQLALDKALKK